MDRDAPAERPRRLTRARVGELWIEHAARSPSFPHVLIVTSFLVTFGIVRGIAYGIRDGWLPVGNATAGGTHIHHYVWGIGLLLVVAYVQVAFRPERGRSICCVLFGIAEALILDEFALLLNLRDVYWAGRGRESLDAVVVAASVLLLIAFLRPFFRALWHEGRR